MRLFKKKNKEKYEYEKFENEIKSLKEICNQQYSVLRTVYSNNKILDLILINTIKNEDGEETCTMKFNDIKSLTTYIKAMNDITSEYLKERL
jgi:hypothetical protein